MMLLNYLEYRGIDKQTILISPLTGRAISIEQLIQTIVQKGKEEKLLKTIDILPFRNDSTLLKKYLSGVTDTYLINGAM